MRDTCRRDVLGEAALFLKRFLQHPRTVGAIAPSSRYLARTMVKEVDFRPGVRVVEFGPGTGSFTAVLASGLPQGSHYLGIERDPVFVDLLRKRLPGLTYACDSVENLIPIARTKGLLPLDHIISGLPFASLPASITLPILDAVHSSLRPDGTFTTFQYVHAFALPAARAFRREMRRRFGSPVATRLVMRNIPPAFVLAWRKATLRATA